MKKFVLVLIAAFMLCFTGCSDFIDWLEDQEDQTYIYSVKISRISNSTYENLFVSKLGTRINLDSSGFYTGSEMSKEVQTLTNASEDESYTITRRTAVRWSEVEPLLDAEDIYLSTRNRLESKARENNQALWVEEDRNGRTSHLWIYLELINER